VFNVKRSSCSQRKNKKRFTSEIWWRRRGVQNAALKKLQRAKTRLRASRSSVTTAASTIRYRSNRK